MNVPGPDGASPAAEPGPLAAAIENKILSRPVDPWAKGLAGVPPATTVADLGSLGWRLGGTGLLPPVALLRASALEHNLALMADYCDARGFSLAPHGKTTMAPQIIDRQLALGAWAITTGSVAQTRTLAGFGVGRLLLAHQVYDEAGLREIGKLLADGVEVISLVDSAAGVEAMDRGLRPLLGSGRMSVLVELGLEGGRTGCRTLEEIAAVAGAVVRSKTLLLRGIEGYEGVLGGDSGSLAEVDGFLDQLVAAFDRLDADGLFDDAEDLVISAGGSSFFDRVVERFGDRTGRARRVLRSGCYAVHDHGKYQRVSPLDGRGSNGESLRPALEVWAAVASCPEPGVIVLNAGRRDLSFDAGLPVIVGTMRRGDAGPRPVAGQPAVLRLMDQHAVAGVPDEGDLGPGDLVALGISHPCTTFDKWKLIPVVDDEHGVISGVATFF